LIVRGFNRQLCWIAPLSTTLRTGKYHVPVGLVDGKSVSAIISHLRPIDTKRFINRIGYIDQSSFDKTKQAIKDLL
jgi:mRNA-degrading endonuclease toxin of MazEF toxin-antitoxin module